MKCTLRKVDKGIIATIDKRPLIEELYYSERYNMICIEDDKSFALSNIGVRDHKIIASTFGVGMELKANYKSKLNRMLNGVEVDVVDMDKEYSYSIVDGKVVVEL